MKKLIVFMAVAAWALSGCSRQEESDSTTAEPAPQPPMPEMAPPAAPMPPPIPLETVETEDSEESEETDGSADSPGDSMASKGMSTASSLAGDIDWQNLSWDDVPNVPYEDKAQLAAWASSQVEEWKGKLTDAAKTQGISMLSNLGDSGWQGAMKDVVEAVQGVRESNPETWELARGALVSSWENFQSVAAEYIEN